MEDLRTGVGNIFAEAGRLFTWADSIGINVDSVAAGVAQAGALITQGQGLPGESTGDPSAPGSGNVDLAALGSALSSDNLDLAAAGEALGIDTNAILSAVNLNTLGTEIDRVLAQVGLELRQGDVYLNRLGAEQLHAKPGDVLDIFIGPIPVPFRVRAVVEQAGPLGALKPVVAAAGIGGRVFTTVFTIFGIFSIFAGVLLIFLIFVMLAAERRSEMGMARAIGMQRGHLVQMFVSEGMIYDLVAAALGVISARSVVERRQQVGMLRAIGYQPEMVALSFVLEASFIALVGICLGTGAGILMGQAIIGQLFSVITAGRTLAVPWSQIGIIVLAAYLFSLLTTILPAIQASRIYPADALRYE